MMMGRRVINRENKEIYQIIFKKIKVIGNRIENNNFTTGHRIAKASFPSNIIRLKTNRNPIRPQKVYIKIIITTTHLNTLSVRFFFPLERLRNFWMPIHSFISIYQKKKSPLNADVASEKSVKRTE